MSQRRTGRLMGLVGSVVLCSAGAAWAQQSNGPDIIVGQLTDIGNNTASTGFNLIGGVQYDSFAVGTASCNKGNQQINWWDPSNGPSYENRHPVISQNLFRYTPSTGRFEQVSAGSLKHGFYALQEQACVSYFGAMMPPVPYTPYNGSPAGVYLGIGASDPYVASLNNHPGGMGPRFEINASTGLFPSTSTTQYSATSGPPRVRMTDLNNAPAGTRYFAEAQYIVGDDAQFGTGMNKNNNASYQEATITATTGVVPTATEFSMALVASPGIQREKPAIYAWQQVDPTVTLQTYDVPNDGRYILACKVTGNGPYTYEYAVHNLNSNRCGGSFIVPLPGSQATLTNVGFHDPEVHAEPYETPAADPTLDDWTVNGKDAGSTQVSWSGPAYSGTQAVYTLDPVVAYRVVSFARGTGNDHTANVLRWGMMFNFRFTSEVAPASTGQVAVGLWRPGTGSAIIFSNIPTPGGATVGSFTASCCTAGVCSVATQASCAGAWGTPGTTCTPDPCVPGACCISGACTTTTYPSCTGTWTAGGSCSPNICPIPNGACCQNNACAVVQRTACTGTFGGDSSVCAGTPCALGNDLCANAAWVADGVAATGTTAGATRDGAAVCNSGAAADVWFKYRPTTAGSVNLNLCGSSFDTVLSVHAAACSASLVCNDDSYNGGNNACGNGVYQSGFNYNMAANTTYFLRVSGYSGATGNYILNVIGGGGTAPTGACCAPSGSCSSVPRSGCIYSYQGDGIACGPTLCPQPTGACCSGTTCSVVSAAVCTGANTRFVGSGSACNAAGNTTTPCCKGDFNQNGTKTVQDLFDFLGAWFLNSAQADINGGGVTVQDLFDFLAVWFPGC